MTLIQFTKAAATLQVIANESPYPPLPSDSTLHKLDVKLAAHNNKLIGVTNKVFELADQIGLVETVRDKDEVECKEVECQVIRIPTKKDGVEYFIRRETDANFVTAYTYDVVRYGFSKFTPSELPRLVHLSGDVKELSNNSIATNISHLSNTLQFQVALVGAQAILDQVLARLPSLAEASGKVVDRRRKVAK